MRASLPPNDLPIATWCTVSHCFYVVIPSVRQCCAQWLPKPRETGGRARSLGAGRWALGAGLWARAKRHVREGRGGISPSIPSSRACGLRGIEKRGRPPCLPTRLARGLPASSWTLWDRYPEAVELVVQGVGANEQTTKDKTGMPECQAEVSLREGSSSLGTRLIEIDSEKLPSVVDHLGCRLMCFVDRYPSGRPPRQHEPAYLNAAATQVIPWAVWDG